MQHYNPSIGEDLHRIFNLKGQSPSNEVSDEIVPVINIAPRTSFSKNATTTNSTGGTVFTTATDKDTYITHIMLSMAKDATAVSALTDLRCTIDGAVIYLAKISGITLTAQNDTIALSNLNIRVDRGTNITMNNSNATANIRCDCVILGYTVETLK